MVTQQIAANWLNGGWKSSPYSKIRFYGIVPKRGIDVDGAYGFQCWDFVAAFLLYCVHYRPWGNAIDLWRQNVPGFTKIPANKLGAFRLGDVLVYGAGWGGGLGHTDIALNSSQAISQNYVNASINGSPPAVVGITRNGLLGVWRPNFIATPAPKPAPAPGVPVYTVTHRDFDGLAAAMARIHISNWQHIADINGLKKPYVIYPGQRLKLK